MTMPKTAEAPAKDARLYLRKMVPEDLEPLYLLLSDPEVMRYLEPPYTRKKTEQFLNSQGLASPPRILAVDDKDHRFMGYVIFHDYDAAGKEIGWVLKKESWGHGMASLLTKQLLVLAAAEGKDAVIECLPEQRATRAIAEKYGFTKVGKRDGLDVYRRCK